MTSTLYDDEIVGHLSRIWATEEFSRDLQLLNILGDHGQSEDKNGKLHQTISALLSEMRSNELVDDKLIEELTSFSSKKTKYVTKNIQKELLEVRAEAFEALKKVPPSARKAASYLEAEFRFDKLPWEAIIWKSFAKSDALDRLRSYREDKGELPPSNSSTTSAVSRHFSHYLVALGLSGDRPDNYVLEFERGFQDDLSHILSCWKSHFEGELQSHYPSRPESLIPSIVDVCFSLWLWSSVKRFRERFRYDLDTIFQMLLRLALPNGAVWEVEPALFTKEDAGGRALDYAQVPSNRATGLFANALFALGRDEWIYDYALKACEWLSTQQQADGGWAAKSGFSTEQADVFTTYLAIEALRRSGEPAYEHNVDRGREWLLGTQDITGAWEAPNLDVSFVTRIILEHFNSPFAAPQTGTINGLESTARELLMIAKQLAMQGGAANRKMATISLAHSLEFSLYAMLTKIEISFFKGSGDRTIGAKQAMAELRDYLLGIGNLRNGQSLRFQSQLSMLVTSRDAVVHKNAYVDANELQSWIREVEDFIVHYRRELY